MEFDTELFGKRKKKVNSCPNPLFLFWLTEWRNDAAEKGVKTHYTYSKAIKSLKKYPLPLESGKACKFLEHFGDKICQMLDKKLADYVSEYGTTEPIPGVIDLPGLYEPAKKKKKKATDNDDIPDNLHVPPPTDNLPHGGVIPVQRKPRKSGAREYMPAPRTGPHALIVTLYINLQNGRRFLSKKDLMTEAQPLSEKSFTLPDPGCRYTAWSSMGTLIRKGYVIKESSPAKYSITDAGCELAYKLLQQDEDNNNRSDVTATSSTIGAVYMGGYTQNAAGKSALSPEKGDGYRFTAFGASTSSSTLEEVSGGHHFPGEGHVLGSSEPKKRYTPSSPELPALGQDYNDEKPGGEALRISADGVGFKFVYIDDTGVEVVCKDQAAVLIDDDIGIGFLVKCVYEDLLMSSKRYSLDTTRNSVGDYVYAYLHNDDAPDLAPLSFKQQTRPKAKSFQIGSVPEYTKHFPPPTATSTVSSLDSAATRKSEIPLQKVKNSTANTSLPSDRTAYGSQIQSPGAEDLLPNVFASTNKSEISDEELPSGMPLSPETFSSTGSRDKDQEMSAELKSFNFVYIDDAGIEVVCKDKAAVLIDDDIGIGFLIKCIYEDLLMSCKRYSLDTTRNSTGDSIYAYLHNDDAPDLAPLSFRRHASPNVDITKPTAAPGTKLRAALETSKPNPSSTTNSAISKTNFSAFQTSGGPVPNANAPKSSVARVKAELSSLPEARITGDSVQKTFTFGASTKLDKTRQPDVVPDEESLSGMSQVESLSGMSQSQSLDALNTTWSCEEGPLFTFQSGTFEVVLIVDNREHYGRGNSKQVMMQELQKNGVPFDVRPLQVGDFAWIAREKKSVFGASGDQEAVLDYIVERKRMDDLAGSVTDGRFREQKFRMCNCGIQNGIYLVEDYGSVKNFSVPEDTLIQAITNSQVIDGFCIKRTKDTKESVAYLTMMTRYLRNFYSGKTLQVYPVFHIKKEGYKNKAENPVQRLMPFKEFNDSAVKTKAMTVQEMFARQLVQVHGMTVEKAAAVVQTYPTPALLYNAYSQLLAEKEKETLLSPITYGPMHRKLGDILSKQVYTLYCKKETTH